MSMATMALLIVMLALAFGALLVVALIRLLQLLGRGTTPTLSDAIFLAGAPLLYITGLNALGVLDFAPQLLYFLTRHTLQFTDFLVGPVICAVLAGGALAYFLRARWRKSMSVSLGRGLLVLLAAFLIAGQVQFYWDVMRASERLGLRCWSARPFPAAIAVSIGATDFDFHAVGLKGKNLYAWSFAKRDFHELRTYFGAGPRSAPWSLEKFPNCPNRPSNFGRSCAYRCLQPGAQTREGPSEKRAAATRAVRMLPLTPTLSP